MKPAILSAFLLAGCASNPASIAARYEGKTGPQLGLPSALWCADFTNLVRKESGLRTVPSRLAIDQLRHARRISYPVVGAMQITSRGRVGHHVDFIEAVNGDGTLSVIGGNITQSSGPSIVARRTVRAGGLYAIPE